MSRRKDPGKGKPRTGDGYTAKGKKPTEAGVIRMVNPHGDPKRVQPRGWGLARVFDIVTGKERKK